MTRAIVENKKIVRFEKIKEEPIKHTKEEYAKRLEGVARKYNELKGEKENEEI